MTLYVNDPATTELYTFLHTRSLPDALPISGDVACEGGRVRFRHRFDGLLQRLHLQWRRGGCRPRDDKRGGVGFRADPAFQPHPHRDRVRPMNDGNTLSGPKIALQGVVKRFGRKRSEEHTSELQSLICISYPVFCFKKKRKYTIKNSL